MQIYAYSLCRIYRDSLRFLFTYLELARGIGARHRNNGGSATRPDKQMLLFVAFIGTPFNSCPSPNNKSLNHLVGGRGVEPPRITPYGPKPYAFANSAIRPSSLYKSISKIRDELLRA